MSEALGAGSTELFRGFVVRLPFDGGKQALYFRESGGEGEWAHLPPKATIFSTAEDAEKAARANTTWRQSDQPLEILEVEQSRLIVAVTKSSLPA